MPVLGRPGGRALHRAWVTTTRQLGPAPVAPTPAQTHAHAAPETRRPTHKQAAIRCVSVNQDAAASAPAQTREAGQSAFEETPTRELFPSLSLPHRLALAEAHDAIGRPCPRRLWFPHREPHALPSSPQDEAGQTPRLDSEQESQCPSLNPSELHLTWNRAPRPAGMGAAGRAPRRRTAGVGSHHRAREGRQGRSTAVGTGFK